MGELFNQLPSGEFFKINLALLVTLIYMVAYVIMAPFAGTLGAVMVSMLYVHSAKMVGIEAMVAGMPIWKVALAIHVAAWILQFIGHGVFEGRAPALIDSWDQAFLTAPLFVLLEVLFFFGYRKEFHDRIMIQVEKNIKEFKSKQN